MESIKSISSQFKDIQIICPMHPNPNIKKIILSYLNNIKNVILLPPLKYSHFIFLLNKSYIVLTDSGGIQEEAPSLGKPVLVLRNTTERPEAINAGTSKKVGTKKQNIIKNVKELLTDKNTYLSMSKKSNPYGNGNSSKKILKHINNCI